jgi:hypothetical protein
MQDSNGRLRWRHRGSRKGLDFDFSAVSSIGLQYAPVGSSHLRLRTHGGRGILNLWSLLGAQVRRLRRSPGQTMPRLRLAVPKH